MNVVEDLVPSEVWRKGEIMRVEEKRRFNKVPDPWSSSIICLNPLCGLWRHFAQTEFGDRLIWLYLENLFKGFDLKSRIAKHGLHEPLGASLIGSLVITPFDHFRPGVQLSSPSRAQPEISVCISLLTYDVSKRGIVLLNNRPHSQFYGISSGKRVIQKPVTSSALPLPARTRLFGGFDLALFKHSHWEWCSFQYPQSEETPDTTQLRSWRLLKTQDPMSEWLPLTNIKKET